MLVKLILFLIRLKLGIMKYQPFMLDKGNRKKKQTIYFFGNDKLMKFEFDANSDRRVPPVKASTVSLNWLLGKECSVYTDNTLYLNRILDVIRAARGADK